MERNFGQMKISIIIPTHNRAETLRNAIESIISLNDNAEYEFVIVDNNSSDSTKEVVESYYPLARYVFEGNTSFSKARSTGAENAAGDIFLYLDDDVLVRPGSLDELVRIFTVHGECGVVAGRIDPKFEGQPPDWALNCQSSFNGWSLFNESTYSFIRASFQEVPSAAGPMMAIRREAYFKVKGFPPDTVGVESNSGQKLFNKLYIGPGDYGLCLKIKDAGYKIFYSNAASVFHVIPPLRFSVRFWRSRMIGEGYHQVISEAEFFKPDTLSIVESTVLAKAKLFKLYRQLERLIRNGSLTNCDGLSTQELWIHYYKAYLDMKIVLDKHPSLSNFLWTIGENGVSDSEYDVTIDALPFEYKDLVSSEFIYFDKPVSTLSELQYIVFGRGVYKIDLVGSLASRLPLSLLSGFFRIAKSINRRVDLL